MHHGNAPNDSWLSPAPCQEGRRLQKILTVHQCKVLLQILKLDGTANVCMGRSSRSHLSSCRELRKNDTCLFDDSVKRKGIMLLASVASVASIGLALQSESSIMTAASLMGVISCGMAGLPGFFAGILGALSGIKSSSSVHKQKSDVLMILEVIGHRIQESVRSESNPGLFMTSMTYSVAVLAILNSLPIDSLRINCNHNIEISLISFRLNLNLTYTTTEKEVLAIVECLKQFRGIIFGYPIDVWSDHKNLVYAATLSESQHVMRWCLILKEFGPNIQHIPGVDNIVADTLSRLPSANTNREDDSTESLRRTNKLFVTNGQATDDSFPLTLSTRLYSESKIKS